MQYGLAHTNKKNLTCEIKHREILLMYRICFFFSFLIIFPPLYVLAQTDSCCKNPACNAKAAEFAQNLVWYIRPFGPYVDNDSRREILLDSLDKIYPDRLHQIEQLLSDYDNWAGSSVPCSQCVNSKITDLQVANWLNYFLEAQFKGRLRSPEFVHGLGGNININQGVIAPFTSSEQYNLLGEAFFSYTFTKKGKALESVTPKGYYKTGGNIRLMLGSSFYYAKQTAYILGQLRTEIRLKDVGNNLTTIGCSKLILQGRFNDKYQMAGIGLAFEIAFVNLQLTADYDFPGQHWMFLTGIGYRFYNHFKK